MMVQVSAQSEDGKYLWILEPGSGNRNEFHYLYLSRILPAGGGHRFDLRVAQVATREVGCGMEKGLPVGIGAGQESLSDPLVDGYEVETLVSPGLIWLCWPPGGEVSWAFSLA